MCVYVCMINEIDFCSDPETEKYENTISSKGYMCLEDAKTIEVSKNANLSTILDTVKSKLLKMWNALLKGKRLVNLMPSYYKFFLC